MRRQITEDNVILAWGEPSLCPAVRPDLRRRWTSPSQQRTALARFAAGTLDCSITAITREPGIGSQNICWGSPGAPAAAMANLLPAVALRGATQSMVVASVVMPGPTCTKRI